MSKLLKKLLSDHACRTKFLFIYLFFLHFFHQFTAEVFVTWGLLYCQWLQCSYTTCRYKDGHGDLGFQFHFSSPCMLCPTTMSLKQALGKMEVRTTGAKDIFSRLPQMLLKDLNTWVNRHIVLTPPPHCQKKVTLMVNQSTGLRNPSSPLNCPQAVRAS